MHLAQWPVRGTAAAMTALTFGALPQRMKLFLALRASLAVAFSLLHHTHGQQHHHHDHDDAADGDNDAGIDFCGTRSPTETEKEFMHTHFDHWRSHNHGRSLENLNYSIPLQFVVMEAEDGRGNISDVLLDDLMDAANHGFRDTPFEFHHIGTQRIRNDTYFKCDPDYETEFKSLLRVGTQETLNVFLCNLFAQGRFGIYGVGDFPSENFTVTDGVMLMNPILPKQGVTFGYMEGILSHEVVRNLSDVVAGG